MVRYDSNPLAGAAMYQAEPVPLGIGDHRASLHPFAIEGLDLPGLVGLLDDCIYR